MEIEIKNGQFVKSTLHNTDVLFGIVPGDSFKNVMIPLNPNPRKFTGRSNPNYMRMLHTIINEPHLFIHKNASGITVFVEDFKLCEDGTLILTLDDKRDGIGNGGHTYEILRSYGTDQAYVKMQIVKGLDEKILIDVVESLNLSKRIETYSMDNKRGVYNWHKEALGELADDIQYFEGDTGLTDVRESMGALHTFLYNENGTKNALSCMRGSVNVNHHAMRKFTKDKYLKQVSAIVKDVHLLQRYIIQNQSFLDLCALSHAKGMKRRLANREHGLIRAFTNLLLLGIAVAGTRLDENGIIQWKQGFNTPHLRREYIDSLFSKVFDIVVVEDGHISAVCKRQGVIEKVEKQAHLVASMRNHHTQMELI